LSVFREFKGFHGGTKRKNKPIELKSISEKAKGKGKHNVAAGVAQYMHYSYWTARHMTSYFQEMCASLLFDGLVRGGITI